MAGTETDRRQPGESWSLPIMQDGLRRKGVIYQERSGFLPSLPGMVVIAGRTAVIAVRQALPEPEKIHQVAFQLAYLALGLYKKADPMRRWERALQQTFSSQPVPEELGELREKLEANKWAAHLLVEPAVYDRHYALLNDMEDGLRQQQAIRLTADTLNVPYNTVATWLRHRDDEYEESPSDWFGREALWDVPSDETPETPKP